LERVIGGFVRNRGGVFFTQQLSWIPIAGLAMVPLRELDTFVCVTVIALALEISGDIYPRATLVQDLA
jgi:hypothetical protein